MFIDKGKTPQLWNLAMRSGWVMQLNALERSVRRAPNSFPNSFPLSIASLNFSIITKRQG